MNRVTALRVSLLVSMGIVPVGCGGSISGHDNNETGEPGGSAGGPTSQAGMKAESGSPTGGASVVGGATSQAGAVSSSAGKSSAGGRGCELPNDYDPETGLVTCAGQLKHRVAAVACESAAAGGAPSDVPAPLPRSSGDVSCQQDSSVCNQFQYGYCDSLYPGLEPIPYCASGCITDSDCGSGSVCVCDDPRSPTGGACYPAGCNTDLECGESLCATYSDGCGSTGFACLSPADECTTNDDCEMGYYCRGETNPSRRFCSNGACGRPFLVHEQARVAPLIPSGSWRSAARLAPQTEQLTAAERASLAVHWSYLGQLEHASIAAFARFSLQLLALGAPPELVEDCTQALADETAHTKLCFELASAYAGRAVGPGPLDVNGSLEASSLVDIVDLVLIEGCFGETGAALEAFQAAESAADPVIAAVYARIAADEQRHAELAFRFTRWALERGGDGVAERIAACIATPPSNSAATRDVTLPCLRALLRAGPRAFDAGSVTVLRASRADA